MEVKSLEIADNNGNRVPNALVYLFVPRTRVIVAGITNAAGVPINNPFQADANGRVEFGAPDGEYDLCYTSRGREYRLRLIFDEHATDTLRGDLAMPTGSGLVGWQMTPSTPATTVGAKLRQVVNALDFGVVVNDPAAANNNLLRINDAISYLSAQGGGDLILPAGSIYIRRPDGSTLPEQQYIVLKKGVYLKGSGKTSTKIVRYGPQSIFYTVQGADNSDLAVWDMTLDGNPGIVGMTYFPANHAYIVDSTGAVFANVLFKDCPGLHSLDINGSSNVYAFNCEFMGHDSTLSVQFGGATYYPEAIQISKHPSTSAPSSNIVAENCRWGASENLGATFAAIGNHSGAPGSGLSAQTVRVKHGVAKGLQKYFVRPFCFDDVWVDDVRHTDTAGAFAFICGRNDGGTITPSTNIKLTKCYFDSSGDSFIRTDGNLIVYPATARYSGLLVEDCQVIGRPTINAILLHYFDDVTLVRYKCDNALRGVLGTAISNMRVINPDITNSAANGVELLDATGGAAGLYLNRNLTVLGGRSIESQFRAVSGANVDGFFVESLDVTGSSKAASTREPILFSANSKNGRISDIKGRPTANTFQPVAVVNITSGTDVTVGPVDVPYIGPSAVINSATARSFSSRAFGWKTAAPTTGTWDRGDIIKNIAPAVGQPKGWVCTVAGTPGTWVSEGNL